MVRLRAIGECIIEVGTERLGPDAEMAFALLLVVTLAQGRPVSRSHLVDLLWPATSDAQARHNLRQALYKLRRLGAPVESYGSQVRLPLEHVIPDVLLHGDPDHPSAAALLRPDEPFGEFLAGYAPELSAAFAAWLEEQRGHMHSRLRRAVLAVMLDERRRCNWGAVETLARKCLQLDPLNEEATLALAEATALTGSKRAALTILDGYLSELGSTDGALSELRLPATVLRRRIADRLRPPTSLAVAESCFVGRGESVALLHERFREVRAGHGQAVLLWGEAGIGKSRLAAEFGQLAALEGARVERVISQARDAERPLSLFMDLVPALLALPGGIGCSPESMVYLRRLTEHDPAVLEPSPATREAELLFAGVRQAILDLVDAVAEEAPLVLCVEDAHWLDGQSWRVLRELIDWIDQRRVMLVLTSRQPHATPSAPPRESPQLQLYRLPPLAQDDALALFVAVTSGLPAPPMFRDWCVHVAEGNPFFVRALAVHWVETGELRAPTSLSVLIDQRVARLSELSLRTLQACAVLGKTATFERLELVLEHKRHDLVESVERLSEHGLVATGGYGVPCRHDLIAQAALARLAAPARQLLHRCAAEVLQAEIERSQSAALLWDCAQQWLAAGESERALTLVRSCAAHLLEVGLPAEAAEVYERALDLCETDGERLEMLDLLKRTLILGGYWDRVLKAVSDTAIIRYGSAVISDPEDDDALVRAEGLWRLTGSAHGTVEDMLERIRNRELRPSHRVKAAGLALSIADNACDASSFRACFHAVHPLLHAPGVSTAEAIQLELMYHTSLGTLDDAIRLAYDLVQRARPLDDVGLLAKYLRFASLPLRRSGDFDEAERVLREALSIAERYRLVTAQLNAIESIVLLMLERGAIAEADVWYRHSNRVLANNSEVNATTVTSLKSLGARIALAEHDRELARKRFDLAPQAFESDYMLRRRGGLLALAIELDDAIETAVFVDRLNLLEATLQQTAPWGGQDFNVLSLAQGLRRMGQEASASERVAHYLEGERRERFAAPAGLLRIAADYSQKR